MKSQTPGIWRLRIATFLVAALAAASTAYWVLKWSASAAANPVLPAAPAFSRVDQTDPQVVARLLGGGQKAATVALADSAASHFKLMGVLATGANRGYALISVDGKPARPYQVGAAVNDNLVLRSLAPRSAALAPSAEAPASFSLELPMLAPSEGKPVPLVEAKTAPAEERPTPGAARPARVRARAGSSSE